MGVGLCEFESHRPHKEAASSDAASFLFTQCAENLFIKSTKPFLEIVRLSITDVQRVAGVLGGSIILSIFASLSYDNNYWRTLKDGHYP